VAVDELTDALDKIAGRSTGSFDVGDATHRA
jgi:hypothetical protein